MPNRIGDFLVKIGAMTSEQVDHVLRLQERGDSRIFGEIALELGYLNDDAIKRYVDHVEKWKTDPEPDSSTETGQP
ncbi:MAG: hypothetical protein ABSG21_13055 [Spirochaetia bacterium]|jgi:hypothetical protein